MLKVWGTLCAMKGDGKPLNIIRSGVVLFKPVAIDPACIPDIHR